MLENFSGTDSSMNPLLDNYSAVIDDIFHPLRILDRVLVGGLIHHLFWIEYRDVRRHTRLQYPAVEKTEPLRRKGGHLPHCIFKPKNPPSDVFSENPGETSINSRMGPAQHDAIGTDHLKRALHYCTYIIFRHAEASHSNRIILFKNEVKDSIYLSALRKADGLIHVVRGFANPEIPPPRGIIRPQDDISYMEEEMMLADLVSITTRLEKLEKELLKAKSPEGEKERELLTSFRAGLEEGKSIRELAVSPGEEKLVRSFAFLSQKPLLHMVNVDESEISLLDEPEKSWPERKPKTEILAFCGNGAQRHRDDLVPLPELGGLESGKRGV